MAIEHETVFERNLRGGPVRNMPSGLVPARQSLQGTTVVLEPLNPALHGSDLYRVSHCSDQGRQIWTYLPWGPWPNEGEFLQFLSDGAASFEYIWYVFRLKKTERFRGMACYLDVQPTQGVIEIGGIWFAPEMQRTRAATEALYLMLDYAMSDLNYRRMQWRCNALNQKSRNSALRLGFKYEGTFYNHMIFKGMNRDTAWYSLLDSDWPAVQSIIQKWLDTENFDADGTARNSLAKLMKQRDIPPRG
ncbi:MAG: GNAT family N-acetyltransferase [Hyphomicrobiaceae bacterium]